MAGVAEVRLEDADLDSLCTTGKPADVSMAAPGWTCFWQLRQCLRLYEGFISEVQWRGDTEALILDFERAAGRVEMGDRLEVSDRMRGFWMLLRSRLDDEEIKHAIGLSGVARQHLVELYT